MLTDEQRNDAERQVAQAVGRVLARMRAEIMRRVRNGENAESVAQEYAGQLSDALARELLAVYMAGAGGLADSLALGLPDTFADAAAAWARQHARDITEGVTGTSLDYIRQAVGDYFQQGWTLGQLEDHLARKFGAERAEIIAVTETTRADVESEKALIEDLRRSGVVMVGVWHTRVDELVCQICQPRDKQRIEPGNATAGEYPPAHPRCRCTVGWILPDADYR